MSDCEENNKPITFKSKKRRQIRQRIKDEDEDDNIETVR